MHEIRPPVDLSNAPEETHKQKEEDMVVTARFTKIRESRPTLEESQLPDQIPNIVYSDEDVQKLFNTSLEFWLESFDRDELEKNLEEFINTRKKDDNERLQELRLYFKNLRKAGLIYGSAVNFFHGNPNLHPDFVFFLNRIGKLNDGYKRKKEKKFAQEVIDSLEPLSEVDLSLEQASVEVFHQRVLEFIQKGEAVLAQKEIPVEEYHQFRKEFRHIMNIFQIEAAQNSDNEDILRTFYFLVNMNSALGQIHDGHVMKKHKKNDRYKGSMVIIPENLKTLLKTFYFELRELVKN